MRREAHPPICAFQLRQSGVEQLDFNLLFRWFVGLSINDHVWDHYTFSHNRERLVDEGMARKFFERVKLMAEWQELASNEHFSVDGTLIEAWASQSHRNYGGDGL